MNKLFIFLAMSFAIASSSLAFANNGDGYWTVVNMKKSKSKIRLACSLDRSYDNFRGITNGSFELIAESKNSELLGVPTFISLEMKDGSEVVGSMSYRLQAKTMDGYYLYSDPSTYSSYWNFFCKSF